MKFILASASERRLELLRRIVDDFSVVVSDFDEESVKFRGDFGDFVMQLSKGKALTAANKISNNAVIIACDTIVAFNNSVLGKPKDKHEAISMLRMLSGNSHEVFSGITVLNTGDGNCVSDYVKTTVVFSKLDDDEILKYVESNEPMDKAGAYGIQGKGGVFVKEIHGCYYNVVGLPLNRLKNILREMGVNQ